MTDLTMMPQDAISFTSGRFRARRGPVLMGPGAAALALAVFVAVMLLDARPRVEPAVNVAPVQAPAPVRQHFTALFDPSFSGGMAPLPLGENAPLGSRFETTTQEAAAAATSEEPADLAAMDPVPDPAPPASDLEALPALPPPPPAVAMSAPLPEPRPSERASRGPQVPVRVAGRQVERAARTPALPALSTDPRTFFEKLFGIPQSLKTVLSYAAPEDQEVGRGRPSLVGPTFGSDSRTAVYDIAAHTVYLPNGARLEAHSGLGDRLDDPRYVHERNRGATPPHLYDLDLRSEPFHGVQALRLNPIGGGSIYGRTGILAHTFMLGPRGDSNGCVSFRNYNAFLQAYQSGQVRRIAVVAHL